MYIRGFFTRMIQLVIKISFSFPYSINVIEVDYSRSLTRKRFRMEACIGEQTNVNQIDRFIATVALSRCIVAQFLPLLFLILLGLRDLSCKFYGSDSFSYQCDPLRSATIRYVKIILSVPIRDRIDECEKENLKKDRSSKVVSSF